MEARAMMMMICCFVLSWKNLDVTAISWGHHISCSMFRVPVLLPELLQQQNEHNILCSYCCALKLGLEVEERNFPLKFFLISTAESQCVEDFSLSVRFHKVWGKKFTKKAYCFTRTHKIKYIHSSYHNTVCCIFLYALYLITNSFEENF